MEKMNMPEVRHCNGGALMSRPVVQLVVGVTISTVIYMTMMILMYLAAT
jgi:hypothetical protein